MKEVKPVFMFFKTASIIIDDDIGFLDTLKEKVSCYGKIIACSRKDDFLSYIECKTDFMTDKIITSIESIETDNDSDIIEICLKKNMSYIEEKNKNDIISVAIIDYSMPGENGLDLCRFVKSQGIRTIMLTGVGTHKIAVEAFNEGIIDRFISKHTENLFPSIIDIVAEEKRSFFSDLHKRIISSFSKKINLPIHDNDYINIFQDVLQDSHAVEYYIVDHNGSCVFVDEQGIKTVLACVRDSDIEKYINFAIDNNAAPELVKRLSIKKEILFLLSEESSSEPVASWGNYLFEAKRMSTDILYSIIRDVKIDY